ncbi:hypothetical protein EJP67_10700 [Variovorax guangxiensis]|uniref:Uncharacterized protein n=1 Tax=Variovorax guangxiensis TaxID=1775474 RepID=A0A433MI82_9BURK|nr:hypothetical protein [Variovorax guangxiensis]RUR67523.1 hypothetical protein EJP67_10700 [Variovorax guangxiensis]
MSSPTINDVRKALTALLPIKRPRGDNEGDAIDNPSVYDGLAREDQDKVDLAKEVVRDYVLYADGEVNNRAVTAVRKAGFNISIGPGQYDPMRTAGRVLVGDWELSLSDPE